MNQNHLDKLNGQILSILQRDATMSVKDISEKIGLSYTATYERIRQLEESGVILHKTCILDPKKIEMNFFVYCNVVLKQLSKKTLLDFEKAASKMPEVMEVISLSGNYDYMLKVVARDMESYNDFVMNKLSNIPNIGHFQSNIVMNMVKVDTKFPLHL
jgi:Lrp/AsnC family transcriptional regulator